MRGRGLRWGILRDMVAVLSLAWMTTSEVQAVMTRLRGLTYRKTIELLDELQKEGSIVQEKDKKEKRYKWGANKRGVLFWIKTVRAIPVWIAEAVSITRVVKALEEAEG